jgi:hypothetical protein
MMMLSTHNDVIYFIPSTSDRNFTDTSCSSAPNGGYAVQLDTCNSKTIYKVSGKVGIRIACTTLVPRTLLVSSTLVRHV